jgi:beta-lactam-binding protein with PASTA domain
MKNVWKTRQFWRTITLMVGVSLLIVILTLMSLRIFTRHNQSFVVPDFTGLKVDMLGTLQTDYGFEFIVIDSVFDETLSPGSIIRHDQEPYATVKRGRKFYISLVSSMPDMVVMPNLIDLSLRQATAMLESRGLFVGTIIYKPDHFQNAVIDQLYRGIHISFGEKVRKGSYINLVVSGTERSNREDKHEEYEENEDMQIDD